MNPMEEIKHVKPYSKSLAWLLALCVCATPAFSLAEEEASAQSLEARIAKLEQSTKIGLGSWLDRISLSGLIEVEAGYVNFDPSDGRSEDESDLTLATVELGIDVDFVKHVSGHIVLLWEEGETEPLDVDEAYIRLDGEDVVPLYLQAGRMYVPFGNFESLFVSDPLTLELGETLESAALVGYANDLLELSFGIYKGETKGNHLNSFVASGVYTLPGNAVPGLGLTTGLSWISNLADSDFLSDDEVTGSSVRDKVQAASAFAVVTLNDRWTLLAEYLTALNNFEAGELDDRALKPKAWNAELGYAVTDVFNLAVKYEGGDDLGELLPDEQYGIVASYALFENTTLSLEYLHGEFENRDKQDVITAQLAFEF